MRCLIVDDSKVSATMFQQVLEEGGHLTRVVHDSRQARAVALDWRPDAILLDLMMPHIDGFTLLRDLKQQSSLADTCLIVVSSKPYDADRRRAMTLGAAGFIPKITAREHLLGRIMQIIDDRLRIRFWGVRGTLPVPGPHSLRYGGNTSCVSLEFPDGRLFIFDAGSGIKELASQLMAERPGKLSAQLFISHPHWDHINALPFFLPLYVKSNEFEILGPGHGERGIEDLISAQMDGVFFPVTVSEFAAHIRYRDLQEGKHEVEGAQVETMLLKHPGQCLGYRVRYGDRSICYVTDNELYPEELPWFEAEYRDRLVDFVRGADLLITDSTYTDAEYANKVHWGHSPLSEVASLAHEAQVGSLCLFHHDPDQDDNAIDAKLAFVQHKLQALGSKTQVLAPAEGSELRV